MGFENVAIRLDQLSVAFFGKSVLAPVNLDFELNKLTVLVGRSGSGKTTLLRALNRLNEEYEGEESKGNVSVDLGKGLLPVYDRAEKAGISLSELRRQVAMLFQTPQLLPVNIYKNLSMPLEFVCGFPKKEIKSRIEEALELAGLAQEVHGRWNELAERLSGGQQQRLCLARVIAMQPKILLLDEPTASLDIRSAGLIEDMLKNLCGRMSLILVSHSLDQALRLADSLVVMEEGQVKERFSSVENLNSSTLAALIHDS